MIRVTKGDTLTMRSEDWFNFYSCGFYIIIESSNVRSFELPYWCFEEFSPMVYDRNEILDVSKHLGGKDAVHRSYEMIFDINTNF